MRDLAKKLGIGTWIILLLAPLLLASPLRAEAEPTFECAKHISDFLVSGGLKTCANCHGAQSASSAPKWMASDSALLSLWERYLEENSAGTNNIIIAKAEPSSVSHVGGKNFDPEQIMQIKSSLQHLLDIKCLRVAIPLKVGESLRPHLPLYSNLQRQFAALVGEESVAVKEILKYGVQLGRGDYRINQSSSLILNPATASILERVIQLACIDIVDKRGWAKAVGQPGAQVLGRFINEVTGLPLGNAVQEAHYISEQFKTLPALEKSVLSCAVVLRSEKFLLP